MTTQKFTTQDIRLYGVCLCYSQSSKKRNCALFPDKDGGKLSLTKEETDAVIDEMIFYFENCDEDVVYKRLFGKCICDTEYDEEEMKQVYEELNRCETEAMRLLSKWIMHLWY